MINEQQFSPVAQAIANDFQRSVDQLQQVELNDAISLMPEDIFKSYFLPCFAGLAPFEEKLSLWIGIAGNPFKRVKVVDKQQQVLFIVPPILSSNALRTAIGGDGGLPALFQYIARFNALSPHQAQSIMDQKLTEFAKNSANGQQSQADLATWIEIFKRYNFAVPGFTAVSGVNLNNTTGKSDLEYDPF